MQFSYSRVDCFKSCPYKFKLTYIDELQTIDDYDPQNPLIVGTALHKGIETTVQEAIQEYYNSYPIITDMHVEESIKLEYLIPIVKKLLPENGQFEVEILNDFFKGYIDYLYPLGNGEYGIIDFKYSNNIDNYMQSRQLHVYKYFAEKILKIKVSKLQFLFVPKVAIRPRKTETRIQFRKRIQTELNSKTIKIKEVVYDEEKVRAFINDTQTISNATTFAKNPNRLCDWCVYKNFCLMEDDIDMLPSTSRVAIANSNYKKIWLYGLPFSGKTTLADQAPTPLNLNTDGNVKYVTMARLPIKDEVTKEGRITKRKFAWEKFTEAIAELEQGSGFETIVVDLLEDTYDYCRVYMCDKNGWEHESDDSFKAYDIVRSEFLRTLKRLLNLPYNVILISHEDTSRDIMKKGNDKVTAITPNIAEKLRLKVAGMVDLVARVVVEDDGSRTLNFKSNEVVFGGGRLKGITTTKCELSWEALCGVYDEVAKANKPKTEHMKKVEEFKAAQAVSPEPTVEVIDGIPFNVDGDGVITPVEEPRQPTPAEPTEQNVSEPATPVRRTRRVRGE